MKTIKKYGVKGILSILLMLCMVLSIVPNMPSYADNPSVDKITINGQTLDSNKKYLVNGLASHTGNLDGINCTAMLDNGALTLFNYAGGGISTYTSRTAVDLTIYTIGTNIITEGNPSKYGIYHNSGEIKIGGVPDSKLTINVESGADGVYGISGYMTNSSRAYDITIWGFVDLIVNVENNSIPVPCKAYGVATYGNFSVLENASFKVKVAGRETWGVLVPSGNITINTDSEKEILIESLGAHSDSSLLTTSGSDQIYLEKAQKLHLKWANEGLEPNVQYVNFVKEPLFTDSDGYKNVIYRYREGTPRTLTVTGGFNEDGLASAKYLAGDEATVRAKAPEKNFKFKEWTGTEGLVFLDGTSKTSDEIKFTMPDKDVSLTAIYEQNLFEIQPKNNTSYAGNDIPFNWTISDYEGSLDDVDLQMKNGEVWKRVSVLPSSYKNPGFHTMSQSSSTAAEKTYRLKYRIYLDNFYSDEFTLKWLPAQVSNVYVTPNSSHPNVVEVEKGKTQQFTATVTGLGNFNDQVTWELEYAQSPYTEITQDGLLIVSEDETADEIQVFARAKGNLSKFYLLCVNIKEPPAFVTGISIYPSEVELALGQSSLFMAHVTGINAFDDSVNWSVSGHENASISETGELQIYSSNPVPVGEILTITATSAVEPSISATAKVTIVEQGVVTNLTISPKIVTVEKGTSQNFTAEIMGTGNFSKSVNWVLQDMNQGGSSDSSISNIGLNATVNIGANESKTQLKVKVSDSKTYVKSDFA
ncbi:MAG TPA: hypothetical protein VFC79_01300, partial [Tissierellaceae bacterium]|nr:hypothetical protein [Tissierellaceae bacterium]